MTTNVSDVLGRLGACLAKLPGVGRRSAERMALRLARNPQGLLRNLVLALEEVGRSVRACSRCGNVTAVEQDPCRICADPERDKHLLCVVEDPNDIQALERSGGYRGRYHALMGKISPMKGLAPGDLRIKALLERVRAEKIGEVVLALNTDTESEATAAYLRDLLAGEKVRITRLAYGLPAGSGIAYSDPLTLERAMRGRMEL